MIIDESIEKIREYMRISIDAGKKCKPENEEHKPKVGALLVKDGVILESAFRGEISPGAHAEFTLLVLKNKIKNFDCSGATLFTTLEPCTSRKNGKKPCAEWIIEKKISKVYIGMYDPNPVIMGKGYDLLRQNGIEVYDYFPEFSQEIKEDNFLFIEFCKNLNEGEVRSLEDMPYHISPHFRSLDDWYHIINKIYFDKNFFRDAKLIFTHLVEILGGLTILYTNKQKNINPEEQIAKAIAWWLVLCGKMNIRSVQDMLFIKFPYCCPYCFETPHNEEICRQRRNEFEKPDWKQLLEKSKYYSPKKPFYLSSWQQMFYKIYPISDNDDFDKVLGRLTEEMGELAESIRVFKISPTYFLSEASDVFAWLMHLMNLYENRKKRNIKVEERGIFFEEVLYKLYPDKCSDCGQNICACPPILKSTIGRITNDGPSLELFESFNSPFMSKSEVSIQFDDMDKDINIGHYSFESNSNFIKTLYHFSNKLMNELRRYPFTDSQKFDKIIETLQIINSYSSTQRVTQNSINRFLSYSLNLNETEKNNMIDCVNCCDHSDWKNAVISLLQNSLQ